MSTPTAAWRVAKATPKLQSPNGKGHTKTSAAEQARAQVQGGPDALRTFQMLRAHALSRGAPDVKASPLFRLVSGEAPGAAARLTRLEASGALIVPWTVNTPEQILSLLHAGVDGIISDAPEVLRTVLETFDADGDGKPDLLDSEGLVNTSKFDAQGHRGARNLRPENTLPAFEAGLDALVSTLETDTAVTADGCVILSHNKILDPGIARRVDGRPDRRMGRPLHDLDIATLQRTFVFDRLQPSFPSQSNDPALSPVAVAFSRFRGWQSPYAVPRLTDLFEFVRFYAAYYKTGPGKGSPDAERRWKNAERVRFNVETKVTPESEEKGVTLPAKAFAEAVGGVVHAACMDARVDIQSFDPRTLLVIHDQFPTMGTSFLFEA